MKIAERVFLDENKLLVQETHDFNPTLEMAGRLRSGVVGHLGESKLVGLVPMKMWAEWAKKWGVNPNDASAMREVVARELADSDNAHLRVWGGKY
jgi:hypothetical protein